MDTIEDTGNTVLEAPLPVTESSSEFVSGASADTTHDVTVDIYRWQ